MNKKLEPSSMRVMLNDVLLDEQLASRFRFKVNNTDSDSQRNEHISEQLRPAKIYAVNENVNVKESQDAKNHLIMSPGVDYTLLIKQSNRKGKLLSIVCILNSFIIFQNIFLLV